jgi:hypothetical protein
LADHGKIVPPAKPEFSIDQSLHVTWEELGANSDGAYTGLSLRFLADADYDYLPAATAKAFYNHVREVGSVCKQDPAQNCHTRSLILAFDGTDAISWMRDALVPKARRLASGSGKGCAVETAPANRVLVTCARRVNGGIVLVINAERVGSSDDAIAETEALMTNRLNRLKSFGLDLSE